MSFVHKVSHYSFAIINCYLPPSNSIYGRDATDFMAHVLSIIYRISHYDAVYIVGDVNSRLGDKTDFVENIDNIPARKVIDHTHNSHGEVFLDFLLESKMCVVNGRISPVNDNFTRVHTTGSSVVDYISTFHDNLKNCKSFNVHLMRPLLQKVGQNTDKIPDHSVLEFDFIPHSLNEHNDTHQPNSPNISEAQLTSDENTDRYFTRYNVRNIPVDFMNSDMAAQAINECIDNILHTRNTQTDIDNMYSEVCNLYYSEMDKWFKSHNINSVSRKKFRNSSKPYWNDNLSELWTDMCKAESNYLKAAQNSVNRRSLLNVFKNKQYVFDKAFKKAKRKFEREKRFNIEHLNTNNPKEFWSELEKLGPRKSTQIPMEVYDNSGNITNNTKTVLNTWKDGFKDLYEGYDNNEFDTVFYDYAMSEKARLESLHTDYTEGEFNHPITLEEVSKVLTKMKNNKAVGIDNLPNEILKNHNSATLLTHLFDKIFQTHIIPTAWKKSIVKPIPKGSTIDPRLPTQYRGIALLSTVYKIYTCVLNNRIVSYMEDNNLYAEEQNGFRQGRSCNEHIFSLTSIIRNRKIQGKQTYTAFLDAEKAFDRVDRNLLLYKLLTLGLKGHIYENIKCIYHEAICCINVNNMLTDWFKTDSGVKQGDTLSPTLFNIFINDLVTDVKSLNLGIDIDGCKVSILLYADDIVLIAESESDLQKMLDCVYNWSQKFKIRFNARKSNIVHFRKASQPRTSCTFKLGNIELGVVNQYKYLGVILNEFLDYSVTAKVLADSANRALGAIINKYKSINGLGYYTYTRMFQSGVCPILDYSTEIWGFKSQPKIDAIQNKAIRIFLGVHRFAPIAAICGDMGWTHSSVRQKVSMVRFWNRIVNLDENRLPRKILDWDIRHPGNTWSSDLKSVLTSIDQVTAFDDKTEISTKLAWASLHEIYCNEWKTNVLSKPKLRTYIDFKPLYKAEDYVISFISRAQRSYLAQLRCGILPLHLETGRWYGTQVENRICKICNNGQVENEHHFLFYCDKYRDIRIKFYEEVCKIHITFLHNDDVNKLKLLMDKSLVKIFSRYICNIYKVRQKLLFSENN